MSSARSGLDFGAAFRLLSAASITGLRPVDALIEQHAHERDPEWARAALTSIDPTFEATIERGSVEALESLRATGMSRFRDAGNSVDRNAALLLYALAIAAALDRFESLLTKQSAEEVDMLLAGAASCVPPGWRGMLDRAIERHGAIARRRSQ